MSLPAWKDRLPRKQSLKDEFVSDIQHQEKNLILGPVGASSKAVHPTKEGSPVAGKHARPMHDRETTGLSNV